MVNKLKKNKAFLILVLTTDRKQALTLLSVLTLHQTKVLYEVFHNILANTLDLDKRTIKQLSRYKRVVKYLAGGATLKNKQKYIKTHKNQVFASLRLISKRLLPFVDNL